MVNCVHARAVETIEMGTNRVYSEGNQGKSPSEFESHPCAVSDAKVAVCLSEFMTTNKINSKMLDFHANL